MNERQAPRTRSSKRLVLTLYRFRHCRFRSAPPVASGPRGSIRQVRL